MKFAALAALLLFSVGTHPILAATQAQTEAVSLTPFEPDSLQQLVAAQQGKPFVLLIWSIDCVYCKRNFEMLSELRKQQPRPRIVTLTMDTAETSAEIIPILKRYQLTRDAWVFGSAPQERLRYAVEANWMGEMPRTYFYKANGMRHGVSGVLTRAQWSEYLAWMRNPK